MAGIQIQSELAQRIIEWVPETVKQFAAQTDHILLFMDVETTGLAHGNPMVEAAGVAVCPTYDRKTATVDALHLSNPYPENTEVKRVDRWDAMESWPTAQHTKTGILHTPRGKPVHTQGMLTDSWESWCVKLASSYKLPILPVGRNIAFDIDALRRDGKGWNWQAFCTHRVLDVTGLDFVASYLRKQCLTTETLDTWTQLMVPCIDKLEAHTALGDVAREIRNLQLILETMLVSPESVRKIAERPKTVFGAE